MTIVYQEAKFALWDLSFCFISSRCVLIVAVEEMVVLLHPKAQGWSCWEWMNEQTPVGLFVTLPYVRSSSQQNAESNSYILFDLRKHQKHPQIQNYCK